MQTACNVSALAASASVQAASIWNSTQRCSPAAVDIAPFAYTQMVLAQAVARHDPGAAMSILSQVFDEQYDSGLMPTLSYRPPGNCRVFPPATLWANASSDKLQIGLAAPPIHSSSALDVFYRSYGAAVLVSDPTESSLAQTNALLWLRQAWDTLYDWHEWLWENRVLPPEEPPEPTGAAASDPKATIAGLLFSISPLESSQPWATSYARALLGAPNITNTSGCEAATLAMASIPASIAFASSFPGAGAYRNAWCQTGCVVHCGYDAACVAASCPLAGFVSTADNALFALASDDLYTIGQWLTLPNGPSSLLPVPAEQLTAVSAWRGVTAQAMVDTLFQWDGSPVSRKSDGRDHSASTECGGWIYDGVLQPSNGTSVAPFRLQLQTDTMQASAAAALGITLPSEWSSQTSSADGPQACPGTTWRDAVVATLLSPAFEAAPMLPSLARTDKHYRPRHSFQGPMWLGSNARALWGLGNRLNSDAAVHSLVASQTIQWLCTATSAAAPRDNASAPPTFFSGYDASASPPIALRNSTALFADSEALLAPAWAALLLAPSTTPVPLPPQFVGGGGLLAVMIGELVVVFVAAGLCVVLGARQISRLRLQQLQEDSEGGGASASPLLDGQPSPKASTSPGFGPGRAPGAGIIKQSSASISSAAASVASALAAHVQAASRRKRGSVRFADTDTSFATDLLETAAGTAGSSINTGFRPILSASSDVRSQQRHPHREASFDASALRAPSPVVRPVPRPGSATPSPMLGATLSAAHTPSPALLPQPSPQDHTSGVGSRSPVISGSSAWSLYGVASSAASLPFSLVRLVTGSNAGDDGFGGGPSTDPHASVGRAQSGGQSVSTASAPQRSAAPSGVARAALLATIDVD